MLWLYDSDIVLLLFEIYLLTSLSFKLHIVLSRWKCFCIIILGSINVGRSQVSPGWCCKELIQTTVQNIHRVQVDVL